MLWTRKHSPRNHLSDLMRQSCSIQSYYYISTVVIEATVDLESLARMSKNYDMVFWFVILVWLQTFNTTKGLFTVELFGKQTPLTVENFVTHRYCPFCSVLEFIHLDFLLFVKIWTALDSNFCEYTVGYKSNPRVDIDLCKAVVYFRVRTLVERYAF